MSVWPHGGGLNKYGCHNETKTSSYHCHQSKQPVDPPQNKDQESRSEEHINKKWCKNKNGIQEYQTKDGTYVDCLTEEYAVEVEFDYNWKEAIGQSLHYSESTNKKAAILFIKQESSKKNYHDELIRVIQKFNLPIQVFITEEKYYMFNK